MDLVPTSGTLARGTRRGHSKLPTINLRRMSANGFSREKRRNPTFRAKKCEAPRHLVTRSGFRDFLTGLQNGLPKCVPGT